MCHNYDACRYADPEDDDDIDHRTSDTYSKSQWLLRRLLPNFSCHARIEYHFELNDATSLCHVLHQFRI